MKKLLFVALAAVGMTACVQNEELAVAGGNVAIAFDNAYVYNPTRNANPTTTTESLEAFDVWAYMDEVAGTVLTDENVTKVGGKWGYASLQYWMPKHTYYFAALAPMDSANVTETLATGEAAKLGLGTIAFTNVDGTEDLLYAKKYVSTPELKDLTEKGMDAVNLQFQHLLSKVKFTFKNGFLTDNMKVVVENVEMSAPAAGSIDLAQADYAEDWNLGADSNGETVRTLNFGNVAELAATASAATANERLTIPAKADYTYNVTFGVKVYSGSVLALTTTKEATISGYALEMGKAYNFTAVIDWNTLALPAIEFTAEVDEWDEEITTPVGRYVSTIEQLQNALNTTAAELGENETLNIYLGADLAGDVNILQSKGVNIVLDGCGHKYDGVITVNGNGRSAGEETLTIQNIKFEASEKKTFISAPSKLNNKYNYSHNVTVQNCTFTGNYPTAEVGGVSLTGTYNAVVKNCVATGMHSLAQFQSCDNKVRVEGVTITASKNGIAFGNTAYPVLKNSTIEAEYYGVRADGDASRGNLYLEDVEIAANVGVVVRKVTTNGYKVTLAENVVLNATGDYQVVFTKGADDEDYVAPTVAYTLSSDKIYNMFPYTAESTANVYTVDDLLKWLNKGSGVIMNNDLTLDKATTTNGYGATGVAVTKGQTIDGGGHTISITAGGTWDSGISTTGGLIKNIWVTKSFRGIFIKKGTQKVVLENVRIEGTVYTISCDEASKQGLEAYNSIFRGWTSYAKTIGTAYFEGCTFGAGGGYNYMRPYAPTTYKNCTFEAGHKIDPVAKVTFENCTFNGVAVTAANVATLVTNIANATVIE